VARHGKHQGFFIRVCQSSSRPLPPFSAGPMVQTLTARRRASNPLSFGWTANSRISWDGETRRGARGAAVRASAERCWPSALRSLTGFQDPKGQPAGPSSAMTAATGGFRPVGRAEKTRLHPDREHRASGHFQFSPGDPGNRVNSGQREPGGPRPRAAGGSSTGASAGHPSPRGRQGRGAGPRQGQAQ